MFVLGLMKPIVERLGPQIFVEEKALERLVINPWTWQDQLGFVQGTEISGQSKTLVCAGQTSVDDDGAPVNINDMLETATTT